MVVLYKISCCGTQAIASVTPGKTSHVLVKDFSISSEKLKLIKERQNQTYYKLDTSLPGLIYLTTQAQHAANKVQLADAETALDTTQLAPQPTHTDPREAATTQVQQAATQVQPCPTQAQQAATTQVQHAATQMQQAATTQQAPTEAKPIEIKKEIDTENLHNRLRHESVSPHQQDHPGSSLPYLSPENAVSHEGQGLSPASPAAGLEACLISPRLPSPLDAGGGRPPLEALSVVNIVNVNALPGACAETKYQQEALDFVKACEAGNGSADMKGSRLGSCERGAAVDGATGYMKAPLAVGVAEDIIAVAEDVRGEAEEVLRVADDVPGVAADFVVDDAGARTADSVRVKPGAADPVKVEPGAADPEDIEPDTTDPDEVKTADLDEVLEPEMADPDEVKTLDPDEDLERAPADPDEVKTADPDVDLEPETVDPDQVETADPDEDLGPAPADPVDLEPETADPDEDLGPAPAAPADLETETADPDEDLGLAPADPVDIEPETADPDDMEPATADPDVVLETAPVDPDDNLEPAPNALVDLEPGTADPDDEIVVDSPAPAEQEDTPETATQEIVVDTQEVDLVGGEGPSGEGAPAPPHASKADNHNLTTEAPPASSHVQPSPAASAPPLVPSPSPSIILPPAAVSSAAMSSPPIALSPSPNIIPLPAAAPSAAMSSPPIAPSPSLSIPFSPVFAPLPVAVVAPPPTEGVEPAPTGVLVPPPTEAVVQEAAKEVLHPKPTAVIAPASSPFEVPFSSSPDERHPSPSTALSPGPGSAPHPPSAPTPTPPPTSTPAPGSSPAPPTSGAPGPVSDSMPPPSPAPAPSPTPGLVSVPHPPPPRSTTPQPASTPTPAPGPTPEVTADRAQPTPDWATVNPKGILRRRGGTNQKGKKGVVDASGLLGRGSGRTLQIPALNSMAVAALLSPGKAAAGGDPKQSEDADPAEPGVAARLAKAAASAAREGKAPRAGRGSKKGAGAGGGRSGKENVDIVEVPGAGGRTLGRKRGKDEEESGERSGASSPAAKKQARGLTPPLVPSAVNPSPLDPFTQDPSPQDLSSPEGGPAAKKTKATRSETGPSKSSSPAEGAAPVKEAASRRKGLSKGAASAAATAAKEAASAADADAIRASAVVAVEPALEPAAPCLENDTAPTKGAAAKKKSLSKAAASAAAAAAAKAAASAADADAIRASAVAEPALEPAAPYLEVDTAPTKGAAAKRKSLSKAATATAAKAAASAADAEAIRASAVAETTLEPEAPFDTAPAKRAAATTKGAPLNANVLKDPPAVVPAVALEVGVKILRGRSRKSSMGDGGGSFSRPMTPAHAVAPGSAGPCVAGGASSAGGAGAGVASAGTGGAAAAAAKGGKKSTKRSSLVTFNTPAVQPETAAEEPEEVEKGEAKKLGKTSIPKGTSTAEKAGSARQAKPKRGRVFASSGEEAPSLAAAHRSDVDNSLRTIYTALVSAPGGEEAPSLAGGHLSDKDNSLPIIYTALMNTTLNQNYSVSPTGGEEAPSGPSAHLSDVDKFKVVMGSASAVDLQADMAFYDAGIDAHDESHGGHDDDFEPVDEGVGGAWGAVEAEDVGDDVAEDVADEAETHASPPGWESKPASRSRAGSGSKSDVEAAAVLGVGAEAKEGKDKGRSVSKAKGRKSDGKSGAGEVNPGAQKPGTTSLDEDLGTGAGPAHQHRCEDNKVLEEAKPAGNSGPASKAGQKGRKGKGTPKVASPSTWGSGSPSGGDKALETHLDVEEVPVEKVAEAKEGKDKGRGSGKKLEEAKQTEETEAASKPSKQLGKRGRGSAGGEEPGGAHEEELQPQQAKRQKGGETAKDQQEQQKGKTKRVEEAAKDQQQQKKGKMTKGEDAATKQQQEAEGKGKKQAGGNQQQVEDADKDSSPPGQQRRAAAVEGALVGVFALSGLVKEEREKRGGQLSRLRAKHWNKGEWDPKVTHIIMPTLARTDKVLCGMAAGNWLLDISFLEDSTPRHWRVRKALSGGLGAFAGLRIVVIGSFPAPLSAESIGRMIKAGGGEVIKRWDSSAADGGGVHLAVMEQSKTQSDKTVKSICTAGVPCVDPQYIIDWLAHPSNSLEKHYLFSTSPGPELDHLERMRSEESYLPYSSAEDAHEVSETF
eukprot:gene30054-35025_t